MIDAELAAYCQRKEWLGGAHLRYLEQIGSTNDVVREAGESGAPEGWGALAELQTAGRGRLDRRWEAPAGSCLLLSLLFRPAEPFAYWARRITMICGIALVDAVAAQVGPGALLKWPNDLIRNRPDGWVKLAGMLSEIGLKDGRPDFIVVGIGINVNVPAEVLPTLAPNAASLLSEFGRPVSRVALLEAFLQGIERCYAELRGGVDPLPEWRARLAWLGEPVRMVTLQGEVEGRAESVDEDGALWIRRPDGDLTRFEVGDVSLRIAEM